MKQYCKSLQPDTVIRRAESRLNERKYNLAFNNCEHFVAWCKTGVAVSEQVDRASASFAGYGHVVVSAIGDIANATDTAARTAAALGDAFLRNPLAIARGAIDEVPNYPNVVVELFGK